MMPDGTTQSSDTGADKSGIQIPKERFDEVAAQAREARERANEAERRYKELLTKQAADTARLAAIERRFAPEPSPEDAYEDPADKALADVAALRKRLDDRDAKDAQEGERQQAAREITAAIKKAGIGDVEAAQHRLAEIYGSSRYFGHEWNPDTAAAAFREQEKKLAEANAAADTNNTNATRSALHGGGSPPAPATTPMPVRPSPFDEDYKDKLREWETNMEQRLLAEARAAA